MSSFNQGKVQNIWSGVKFRITEVVSVNPWGLFWQAFFCYFCPSDSWAI